MCILSCIRLLDSKVLYLNAELFCLMKLLGVSISKETKLAKESLMNHVFNELIDFSKQFWQVSFFSTILFSVFTLFAAKHAVGVLNDATASSPVHDAIINSIGWVFYLVPIVFGVIALFFGVNTLKGYVESKYS